MKPCGLKPMEYFFGGVKREMQPCYMVSAMSFLPEGVELPCSSCKFNKDMMSALKKVPVLLREQVSLTDEEYEQAQELLKFCREL